MSLIWAEIVKYNIKLHPYIEWICEGKEKTSFSYRLVLFLKKFEVNKKAIPIKMYSSAADLFGINEL